MTKFQIDENMVDEISAILKADVQIFMEKKEFTMANLKVSLIESAKSLEVPIKIHVEYDPYDPTKIILWFERI